MQTLCSDDNEEVENKNHDEQEHEGDVPQHDAHYKRTKYGRDQQQKYRSSSFRYDAASTMERMRSSMMGSSNLPFGLTEKELETIVTATTTLSEYEEEERKHGNWNESRRTNSQKCRIDQIGKAAAQIPAIILIGLFHLMIGIPFGVSYFPIGWSEQGTGNIFEGNTTTVIADGSDDDAAIHGSFPVPAKEALGIRLFFTATIVAQVVFVLKSGFMNPIGLQMVENVPFCHALAKLVIRRQGYGQEALSTLLFLFGLSSVIVGTVFMVLGQLNLGRVVHYFPNHVLVGCIAGIGVFLAKTGVEVTINAVFTDACDNVLPIAVVVAFEALLRLLDHVLRNQDGKPIFPLLSPIFFCSVTPIFYLGLYVFNISITDATEAGYFFPSLLGSGDSSLSSIWNQDLLTQWTVVDIRTISWNAVWDSVPTMVSLTLFSLIHVPINIPAFALSTSKLDLGLFSIILILKDLRHGILTPLLERYGC